MSRSSMRSWVERWGPGVTRKLCTAALLVATTSGCQLLQSPKSKVNIRPAGTEAEMDLRVLEKPFALAVPEDAVVRVVGANMTCTGTVIDDDLILTAHHCLVERGPHGEFSKQLIDPTTLRIELGGDFFAWGEVGVRHIVAPPCGEGGGAGDIAVLVLKRKLIGLSTMTPRLEAPPRVGEEAFAYGFGRCALSSEAIHRKERSGGAIRALSAETLHMEAAVCPGDSGGPVFAKGTHEIIGVISLSAMDHDEKTSGPSVMARLDAYRLVFGHARMVADGTAPNELPPLECHAESERRTPPSPRQNRVP